MPSRTSFDLLQLFLNSYYLAVSTCLVLASSIPKQTYLGEWPCDRDDALTLEDLLKSGAIY